MAVSAWGPLLSGSGRGPSAVGRETIHVLTPRKVWARAG